MKSLIAADGPAHRISCMALAVIASCFTTPGHAGESAFILEDTKAYFTAPLRWDGSNWLYFAGSIAAIGAAHQYDDNVRTHFITQNPAIATDTKTFSTEDAIPAAAALLGTWAFATLSDDHSGKREAWAMAEATALSATTGLIFKYVTGRERPSDTADPDSWRAGGDAFPSLHATAAFAIGTVLAESGNEEYRWVRRAVGYGIGIATSYQRLKHNQHWLSDTVAGAALGISSAHFAMNRRTERRQQGQISVAPLEGGLLLTYSMPLR